MTKVMITGGAGFIGHHMVEHFMKNSDFEVIILDKLNYSCFGTRRIDDLLERNPEYASRIQLYTWDLCNPVSVGVLDKCKDVDYILHLAAETHVDNSITDPMAFVMSNVVGTANILEFARKCENLKAFNMFSTDEVFGPATVTNQDNTARRGKPFHLSKFFTYHEWDRYNSTNPYSATKAGAEQLTLAYMNTYGIPGFISRCMNVFGERQHPEKYIPLCINKILKNETIYIHGNADCNAAGSRFYIHARNVADAINTIMDGFSQRECYNIVGEKEVDNLTLASMIYSYVTGNDRANFTNFEIVDFHSSRPGHDLRYSLSGAKMKTNLNWSPPMSFEDSLAKMVDWTLHNKEKWL